MSVTDPTMMTNVIVVDDDPHALESYCQWLRAQGHRVRSTSSPETAKDLLQDTQADVLVANISPQQPDRDIELLAWAKEHNPALSAVMVGMPAVETAVEALRRNAYDYLVKPVPEAALKRSVGRAVCHSRLLREKLKLEREKQRYQQQLEASIVERDAALERRTRQLLLLHDIARTINALHDPTEIYRQVVTILHETFGYLMVAVGRMDHISQSIIIEAKAGGSSEALEPGTWWPLTEGLAGLAVRRREIIVANRVQDWPEFVAVEGVEARAQAVFPVVVDGALAAILSVTETEEDAFDETDLVVLRTLVNHLSVAVANARLYSQLEDALAIREQMLQNVSHELRTPLAIISGYAEFLLSQRDPEQDRELAEILSTIFHQAQHLGQQVNQLIMLQNVQRARLPDDQIEVNGWLREVVAMWRPILAMSGIALETTLGNSLGFVQARREHLSQVTNNLFDNARKFSLPGGTVRLQAGRGDAEILISLADEGIGVPEDKIPLLFERFYQADQGTTRRFGGMGLGLALVREILESLGGRIWVESRGEEQGFCITFALPAADPLRPTP